MLKKKILVVSYYYPPYNSVAVRRISYWVENFNKFGWNPTVITAVEQTSPNNYPIHYIENKPIKKLSFISKLIKDEGLNWSIHLKKFLEKKEYKFDAVLLTGGPFLHFRLTKYLKNNFNSKIILDFRDPFSRNPRYNDSWIKTFIKVQLEKRFIRYADNCIVVNSSCLELLSSGKNKTTIIENGFDEITLESVKRNTFKAKEKNEFPNVINCVYPGKVYEDFDIIKFIKIVHNHQNIKINFIGDYPKILKNIKVNSNITFWGKRTYEFVINKILENDIGLILTGGKPFESTTKIYDYIGCDKKILVITEGKLFEGELFEITKNLDDVIWAKNIESSILEGINKLSEKKQTMRNKDSYSREAGLKKLVSVLNTYYS